MKNVLIVQPKLLKYRLDLFNNLSKTYNITVAHSGEKVENDLKFEQLVIQPFHFFSFIYQPGLNAILSNYDIVVLPFDPHELAFYMPFYRKAKFLYFGIGFGRSRIANFLRIFMLRRHRALFYSPYGIVNFDINDNEFCNLKFTNNTISVNYDGPSIHFLNRKTFLFVGALVKRKKINNIIISFYYFCKVNSGFSLVIVGDGEEKDNLIRLATLLGLSNKVIFRGHVEDSNELIELYENSVATLHYGQSGLSILQSLGHGVPCIVNRAIQSGGEALNVIDAYNGYFSDDNISEFTGKMIKISKCEKLWKFLSGNCISYYKKNASMEVMVSSFSNAIGVTIRDSI